MAPVDWQIDAVWLGWDAAFVATELGVNHVDSRCGDVVKAPEQPGIARVVGVDLQVNQVEAFGHFPTETLQPLCEQVLPGEYEVGLVLVEVGEHRLGRGMIVVPFVDAEFDVEWLAGFADGGAQTHGVFAIGAASQDHGWLAESKLASPRGQLPDGGIEVGEGVVKARFFWMDAELHGAEVFPVRLEVMEVPVVEGLQNEPLDRAGAQDFGQALAVGRIMQPKEIDGHAQFGRMFADLLVHEFVRWGGVQNRVEVALANNDSDDGMEDGFLVNASTR